MRGSTVKVAAGASIAVLLPLVFAAPTASSQPASSADTEITINVTGSGGDGALSISMNSSAVTFQDVGAHYSYINLSATVTDTRTDNLSWAASASMTDLTKGVATGDMSGPATVSRSNMNYDMQNNSAYLAVEQGTPVLTAPQSGTLAGSHGIVQATSTNGPNRVRITPDLLIAKSAFAVDGTYTATITHSVL